MRIAISFLVREHLLHVQLLPAAGYAKEHDIVDITIHLSVHRFVRYKLHSFVSANRVGNKHARLSWDLSLVARQELVKVRDMFCGDFLRAAVEDWNFRNN